MSKRITVLGLKHDRTIDTKTYEAGDKELVRIYRDFLVAYTITTEHTDQTGATTHVDVIHRANLTG